MHGATSKGKHTQVSKDFVPVEAHSICLIPQQQVTIMHTKCQQNNLIRDWGLVV